MDLDVLGIVVDQDILNDSILSYLSPSHVGPVLQLPQQGELTCLMIHHRGQSRDLSRLVLLEEGLDVIAGQHLFLLFLYIF